LIEERDGKYIIRSGKRRFLAAEQIGLRDIPCVIKIFPFGMGARAGLDTNIQRSANPVDEYNQLLELEETLRTQDRILSDEQLAKILGITTPKLRKMRCVETMPVEVQTAINEQRISIDNAYSMANLPLSRQRPLIETLNTGGRVTADNIKDQKRVLRSQVSEELFPQMKKVLQSRPDLPSKDHIISALGILIGDTELAQSDMIEMVADFVLDLMSNSTDTLDRILPIEGEQK